jgi:hypothetical protein
MDKIADFYERWFANRQDPDYRGAEGESEELVNGLLGVQELNKTDFWMHHAVKLFRATILHLSCKAHSDGKDEMGRFDVMAFFGKIPIEPRWKELVESRAGDERVRLLGADAGEFMLNSPREVAGSVLGRILSFFVSPDHQVY